MILDLVECSSLECDGVTLGCSAITPPDSIESHAASCATAVACLAKLEQKVPKGCANMDFRLLPGSYTQRKFWESSDQTR